MSQPLCNIELKARVKSLEAARAVAEKIATERLGVQRQVDTYFRVANGRLKLREIDLPPLAQLIGYHRPDVAGPKASDYRLVAVENPSEVKAVLASALGIWIVVDKRREIWLFDNVRIHLDEVAGLGTFIELEAVLGRGVDRARGSKQVDWLRDQFNIADEQLMEGSYSDHLALKSGLEMSSV